MSIRPASVDARGRREQLLAGGGFFLIRKINGEQPVFLFAERECLFAQLELCIHFSFSWSLVEDVNKAHCSPGIIFVSVAAAAAAQRAHYKVAK
jgi:hypothetical protein